MSDLSQIPRFFLGANAASGFYSLFEQVYSPAGGWRVVILKGGPGSGKSTLLKRCAQAMLDAGEEVELAYCSADPHSLDAVILPRRKLLLADGTAPHVLEPKYPGACEMLLNPGECWSCERLFAHREAVFHLSARIERQHRRARRFLSAACALLAENRHLAQECLRTDALRTYAQRLGKRLFAKRPFRTAQESRRFLSGVTPLGLLSFDETLSCYAQKLILIDDEYGAASSCLLEELRQSALRAGYSVIVCPSPLFPEEKLEALIIPGLSLALAATDSVRRCAVKAERTIHIRRFMDLRCLSENQAKIRFDRKAARELLAESVAALGEAHALHDELEKIYMAAMDYEKLDRMSETLLDWLQKQR